MVAPIISLSASSFDTICVNDICFSSPASIWSKTTSSVEVAGVVLSSSLYPCSASNLFIRSCTSTFGTARGTAARLASASALCLTLILVVEASHASTIAATSTMSATASNARVFVQKFLMPARSSAIVLSFEMLLTLATDIFACSTSVTSFICSKPCKSASSSAMALPRLSGVSWPMSAIFALSHTPCKQFSDLLASANPDLSPLYLSQYSSTCHDSHHDNLRPGPLVVPFPDRRNTIPSPVPKTCNKLTL